jgi:Ca2+-binding RTX toxin-like protein
MDIITNEATGNLQIPDELILYLADTEQGAGLSVSGPSYDGVTDNAFICAAGDPMPASANTWVADGSDHIRFHIGGGNPFYEGSFSFGASDGLGATGSNTIEVQNFATVKAGSYWKLDGTDADEVLLGLDGRNLIDGGSGDDIIHGGHDSSGDILIGGDGDDVIFGGSGKDDLRGGDGDDTFIMRAGFGRDNVDGGAGDGDRDGDVNTDTISLQSVLIGADVASDAAISNWLTGAAFSHDAVTGTITLGPDASGIIDLGGGNEITFLNLEQIVYTDLV